MLRYLKMDLIATCVAVTSLFGAALLHFVPVRNQTEMGTSVSAKAFVAPTVAAPAEKKERKLLRPLRMLANLGANLGKASWYGSVLDGHRTASGEIFHPGELTACHRTLPFGTMVKVVDVTSGRSVVVRINDRGVLSGDRIIDLSSGAAASLGILKAGVARVRLEVLKTVSAARADGRAAEDGVALPAPL